MSRVYRQCWIEISEGFFQFLLSQVDSETFIEVILVQRLQLYDLIIGVNLLLVVHLRNFITVSWGVFSRCTFPHNLRAWSISPLEKATSADDLTLPTESSASWLTVTSAQANTSSACKRVKQMPRCAIAVADIEFQIKASGVAIVISLKDCAKKLSALSLKLW